MERRPGTPPRPTTPSALRREASLLLGLSSVQFKFSESESDCTRVLSTSSAIYRHMITCILPLPEHHRRTSGRIELTPRVVLIFNTVSEPRQSEMWSRIASDCLGWCRSSTIHTVLYRCGIRTPYQYVPYRYTSVHVRRYDLHVHSNAM